MQLFGSAPDALLNHDLSHITIEELDTLRQSAQATSLSGDAAALAAQVSAASEVAHSLVREVLTLDHMQPARIPVLLALLDDMLATANRPVTRRDDSHAC